jgi:choline-sulfatase
MAGPDIPKGKVVDTAVSLVDLAPTILDAVGEDAYDWSKDLPGRSLFELTEAPFDPERTVFSEYHAFGSPSAGFMLRDGRYKYNYYVGYSPELFDLTNDPDEEHNLAADPAHRDTVQRFEKKLRSQIDPEAIDATAKADQAALIARHGGPEKALYIGAPGATPAPV